MSTITNTTPQGGAKSVLYRQYCLRENDQICQMQMNTNRMNHLRPLTKPEFLLLYLNRIKERGKYYNQNSHRLREMITDSARNQERLGGQG